LKKHNPDTSPILNPNLRKHEAGLAQLRSSLDVSEAALLVSQKRGEAEVLGLQDKIRVLEGEKEVVSKLLETSDSERERALLLSERGEEDLRALCDKIKVLDDGKEVVSKMHQAGLLLLQGFLDDSEMERIRVLSLSVGKDEALKDSQTTLEKVKIRGEEEIKALQYRIRALDDDKKSIIIEYEASLGALTESQTILERNKLKGEEYKKLLHDKIKILNSEKKLVSKEYEAGLLELQDLLESSERERERMLVCQKKGGQDLIELQDKIRILDGEKDVVRKLLEASDLERERVLLLAESKDVALSESQTELKASELETERVVVLYNSSAVALSDSQTVLEGVKMRGEDDMRALNDRIRVLDVERMAALVLSDSKQVWVRVIRSCLVV
jgi:hypothetical protein